VNVLVPHDSALTVGPVEVVDVDAFTLIEIEADAEP
jgi:hypothetical protein